MLDNKKTIIVFSCFYEPYISGAERFVKEVVERLCKNDRFIIITSRMEIRNPKSEIRNIDGNKYLIKRVGLGCKWDKWLYPILAPIAALFFKPAVVHAVMESYAGIALVVFRFFGFLVFWSRKPKMILTLQSGDLDDKAAQGKIPLWLWKRIHTAPDYITAISTFLKKRAMRLGVPEDKISIIPNGVDLKSVFSFQFSVFNRIPHRIVCVARLSPEKGLKYLLDAMPIVKRDFFDAHLVLVGGGILENDLKKQAEQLSVLDSVDFKGALPHDRALGEVGQAEVFICPSLAEGLGIVFIESQAVGTPVIGTRVGGIPDVIQDGETGLLVPPRDARAIAEAIIKIFRDKELAKRMVEVAKCRINRYDWDVIADQVAEVY